jgi:small-conductance mechanosensitive channel
MSLILPYIPSIIVVSGFFVLLIGGRLVLNRLFSGKIGLPYKKQIYSLVLIFVGIIALLLALPIKDVLRGQLFTLFGIVTSALIALSSTTIIGNAMAGLMIRSTHGFKPGDFIEAGEVFGRITEQGLFHVEVQTINRNLITIPNQYILQNPVNVTRSSGTFISAEVSLGYDIPRTTVETVLKTAAETAELREPFVHIQELGDYSVRYRVYGLLEEVKQLVTSRSTLKKSMLDALHKNGIEIVSPSFVNKRQVPEEKQFIPGPESPAGNGKDQDREQKADDDETTELVFDKAEEAESLEKLRERYQLLDTEISERKEKMKALRSADEKEQEKEAIEEKERRKKSLEQLIARKQEEQSGHSS